MHTITFNCIIMIKKQKGSVSLGELKKYKIGEIAALAQVSKRTIDYYTNLGLICPLPSENKFRCYSELTLIRLKLIENLKKKRLTLEEIKEHLDLLEENLLAKGAEERNSIGGLTEELEQLENQVANLQKTITNLKSNPQVGKQAFQGVALIHSLMLYVEEISKIIQP